MKKTVKIPSQIKLQTEFFEGYGMAELIKSIIALAISSIIAYCIYKITKTTLLATFLVIGSTAISVVFGRTGCLVSVRAYRQCFQ